MPHNDSTSKVKLSLAKQVGLNELKKAIVLFYKASSLLFLFLFLSACHPALSLSVDPTITPTSTTTSTAIVFEAIGGAPPPTPTFTPTSTPTHTSTPTSTPTPSNTPTPTNTATPSPSATPTATPTSDATPTETPDPNVFIPPIMPEIILVDPIDDLMLPQELNVFEFKWKWVGPENKTCELLGNYGFEVRIWLHPSNPPVEEPKDPIQPLGVTDAVEDQELIADTCNPSTKMRSFTVSNLRGTPAGEMSKGSGPFFWDVAYIELDPYKVVGRSVPRVFHIPLPAP